MNKVIQKEEFNVKESQHYNVSLQIKLKKPPRIKQELSPIKFKVCSGICLHRVGL